MNPLVGYLVGEPSRSIHHMFQIMNVSPNALQARAPRHGSVTAVAIARACLAFRNADFGRGRYGHCSNNLQKEVT